MHIMSKTEIRKIIRGLNKQFGIKLGFDYVFVESKKGRIFIVNKEINEINLEDFNINTVGLYVFKKEVDGIRMSVEGSQLFGSKAEKNVLVLDDFGDWFLGKNIEVDTKLKGYVIVKCGEDYLGCGKVVKGKLLIPKSRRISELIS